MSTNISDEYAVSKIRLMVPLNGPMQYYRILFRASAAGEFSASVASQRELDAAGGDVQLRPTQPGSDGRYQIEGEVSNEYNPHEEYFLVLRAVTPTNVRVEINKQTLPSPNAGAQVVQRPVSMGGNEFYWFVAGVICLLFLITLWQRNQGKTGGGGGSSGKPSILSSSGSLLDRFSTSLTS